jgi:predicted PurR-regulated permease PerM
LGYLVPVSLINDFLSPIVMAHGLQTPMIVIFIGVLGGVIAHGIIGLFAGPIILAVSWELALAWVEQEEGPLPGKAGPDA